MLLHELVKVLLVNADTIVQMCIPEPLSSRSWAGFHSVYCLLLCMTPTADQLQSYRSLHHKVVIYPTYQKISWPTHCETITCCDHRQEAGYTEAEACSSSMPCEKLVQQHQEARTRHQEKSTVGNCGSTGQMQERHADLLQAAPHAWQGARNVVVA